MGRLFNWLFGCRHRATTWLRSEIRHDGLRHVYVACLDCGAKIDKPQWNREQRWNCPVEWWLVRGHEWRRVR